MPHSPRPLAVGGGHRVQAPAHTAAVTNLEGRHGIVALAAAATAVLGDSKSAPSTPGSVSAVPESPSTVRALADDDDHRINSEAPAVMAGSLGGPGEAIMEPVAGVGSGGVGGGGGAVSKRSRARANPPQRSAIACASCRRSKVKCHNDGGSSPCASCLRSRKNCTYPEVTPTAVKRPAEPVPPKSEQPERKRPRRVEDIAKTEGVLPDSVVADEILAAGYLDQTLWDQLFDLYRLHFATELPFLHLASLKQEISRRARSKQSEASPDTNLVLLGILALTARFSPKLAAYATVPRKPSGPAIATQNAEDGARASAHYADVLTKALGGLKDAMTKASVERVQAFLMLGLYEWSQVSPKVGGMAAWMYVGNAIRMAMALGLNNGDQDRHSVFRPRSLITTVSPLPSSPSSIITAKEVRRRTMFSCFILDRLLGCGNDRVLTIRSDELRIQLPCDERDFDRSNETVTGWLDPSVAKNDRPGSQSLLGCFIRLVDLWGDISKWSFAGGRFTEEDNPPWSPTTTFYALRKRLNQFSRDLPDCFHWSSQNFYRNENPQDMSIYVSLHLLRSFSSIMLHREYLPFIPLRCDRPIGPLDEPTFQEPPDHPGFWEDVADGVFRSARVIVDLVELCQSKLPMSSLVCFTVWTAAYVGIYATKFPHMDVKRRMLPVEKNADGGTVWGAGFVEHVPMKILYKALKQMSGPLKMAKTYVRHFDDFEHYYDKIKLDYHVHASKKSAGENKLSLRISGGGLEEWKRQGLKVVNNGEILAVESDDKHSSRDSTVEPRSSVSPTNNIINQHNRHVKSSSSFTPINAAPQHSINQSNTGKNNQNLDYATQQQQQQDQQQVAQDLNGYDAAVDVEYSTAANLMTSYMHNAKNGVDDEYLTRHIDAYQSQPWIDVPGGNCFAYGAEFYPTPASTTDGAGGDVYFGGGNGNGNGSAGVHGN